MKYELNDFDFPFSDEQTQKDFVKKMNDLNSVLFEQLTFTSTIPWVSARSVAYGKWAQEIDLFIWNLQLENRKDEKRYQHEAFLIKNLYQTYNNSFQKFINWIIKFNRNLSHTGDYNRVFYGFLQKGGFSNV